jgi:hypothetical protein
VASAALRPSPAPAVAPGRAERRLAPSPGSTGRPLEPTLRTDMERRFGHDFAPVRVHAESRMPQQHGAQAVTAGSDVAFAPGRYRPGTPAGRGLIAHELAHVVQQRLQARPAALAATSRAGDHDERGAHAAVRDLDRGRRPALGPANAGLHRQPAGDAAPALNAGPALLPDRLPSQASSEVLILESFLNRMWAAQSDRQKAFRLTPKVLEGLAILFPLGVSLGALTDYESTEPVLAKLRPRLAGPIEPAAAAVLDRLPTQEKPLGQAGPAGDTGAGAGTPGAALPRENAAREAAAAAAAPRGEPAAGGGGDAAMGKALEAAFATFRQTRLGRELEKRAKDYVFSKEGIPLVILVTAGGLVFLAANDPRLPSTPEIEVGKGISLKLSPSLKPSEVPGLLDDLVKDRAGAQGTPERKVTVGATFTFEALGELASAVGNFFVEAGTWIAKGAVTAGTAIGRGAKAAGSFLFDRAPELLFGVAGAGLGAAVGALAGGGIGALVGAGIGLAVGAGAGLAKRFLTKQPT